MTAAATPELLRSLRRRWPLFVLALVPAALLMIATPTPPVGYVGSTTVSVQPPADASARELRQFEAYVRRHIDTFAELATSVSVLTDVIAERDLVTTPRELARRIEIIDPENRALVSLEVTGQERYDTSALAGAIGTALASRIEQLSPRDERGGTLVRAAPFGRSVSAVPPRRSLLLPGLLALVGLGAALAWSGWRFATDDVLRSRRDLTGITTAPVVAVVGGDDEKDQGAVDLLRLRLTSDPASDALSRLVGTTDSAHEAFAVRERLLRSFAASAHAAPHIEVISPTRIAMIARRVPRGGTLTADDSPVLVVVALRRVTGTQLIRVLRTIEHQGTQVAGVIAHLPARPSRTMWRRLTDSRTAS